MRPVESTACCFAGADVAAQRGREPLQQRMNRHRHQNQVIDHAQRLLRQLDMHRAAVELKDSGAQDYWMIGTATVPLRWLTVGPTLWERLRPW